MFVVERQIIVLKEYTSKYVNRFLAKGVVDSFEGFVKREILLDESKKEDVIKVLIYWKDKESFVNWHKSPEHMQGHKNKSKFKEGIVDISVSRYFLINQSLDEKV